MQLSQMDSMKEYTDVTKNSVHCACLLIKYLDMPMTFLCMFHVKWWKKS